MPIVKARLKADIVARRPLAMSNAEARSGEPERASWSFRAEVWEPALRRLEGDSWLVCY
jgi:hypothetical protein